jgi:hypothetical protein
VGTLPQLIGFQPPQTSLADTYTAMARLAAYDQSRRTSAFELEEKRRVRDEDALWRQTIAGAIAPPQTGPGFVAAQPQAAVQPQALAPAPGLSQTSFTGPQGMAQNIPTNQWFPVNTQTGAWGQPGGFTATQPPEIAALAPPVDTSQPPRQGGGFTQAPVGTPQPQPVSLTTAQPQAPAPQPGFTAPQPQKPLSASVPGLMPMPDMAKVQEAFRINPEKTSQWYGTYLTQRGKQLDEVDRNNKLVYQYTSAILENPEFYRQALEQMREQGVPIPKNMPTTFNAALVKFHNDVSRQRLDPLQEAQRENQLALAALNRDKLLTQQRTRDILGTVGEQMRQPPGGERDAGSGTPLDTRALSPAFLSKSQQVADRLEMRHDDLLRIMHFETGGTFDPGVKNRAGSGATGLIQFMPDTAKRLGTTSEALAKMTPEQQLDYVEKYLSQYKGRIGTLDDAYMAVLYPEAMGKGGGYRLFTKEGNPTAYRQNAGLDREGKGYVTVADAVAAVQRTTGGMDTTTRGEAGGTTSTARATPEVQRLNQEIAKRQRIVDALSLDPEMNTVADNQQKIIDRLTKERDQLTEPQRAGTRVTAEEQARYQQKQQQQAGPMLPEDRRKLLTGLRTDIRAEPTFKIYQEVRNGYQNVQVGAQRDSSEGDLALIYGLAKILDPGSVVRESEFATVAAAQGKLQQLLNTPQRFFEGDRLTPENRKKLLSMAQELKNQKLSTAARELRQVYEPLAREGNIQFSQLLPLEEETPAGTSAPSPTGTTGTTGITPTAKEDLLKKHTR